jgi:hypothetical protein
MFQKSAFSDSAKNPTYLKKVRNPMFDAIDMPSSPRRFSGRCSQASALPTE